MGKYDEIMDKIDVTDELKNRILSQMERVDISPRENTIVPMRLARRILPFAACAAIVVAVFAVPQIRQKSPQKPGEENPTVEGLYAPQEVASAEKLSEAVGFPVKDIASLKEKATDRSYMTYGDGLAEITYRWDSQNICFRQSQGQEDNSGDYNSYATEKIISMGNNSVTLKGEAEDKILLATWSDGTYSYSLSMAKALKKADVLGIIEEIEKNI